MTVSLDFEPLEPKKNNSVDEPLAEPTRGRKVLRIEIEIDVSGKKTHAARLLEAYRQAVSAAATAAREVMQEDTIKGINSRMNYGYRHLEGENVEWELNSRAEEEDAEL